VVGTVLRFADHLTGVCQALPEHVFPGSARVRTSYHLHPAQPILTRATVVHPAIAGQSKVPPPSRCGASPGHYLAHANVQGSFLKPVSEDERSASPMSSPGLHLLLVQCYGITALVPDHDGVGDYRLTSRERGRDRKALARCGSAGRASALQATGPERCSLQDWAFPENPSVIGCHKPLSKGAIPPPEPMPGRPP